MKEVLFIWKALDAMFFDLESFVCGSSIRWCHL